MAEMKGTLKVVATWDNLPYNKGIALLNFFSPCTFLYPFGYTLNEVGQKECESTFTKDRFIGLSFNFPVLLRAGRKTVLAEMLGEKTVHVFCVQNNLIGCSNTSVKAYNYVGLILCCVKKNRFSSFNELNSVLFLLSKNKWRRRGSKNDYGYE